MAVAGVCALLPRSEWPSEALSAQISQSVLQLHVANDYERTLGIPIGDGMYPFEHLVEMYQVTSLTLQEPSTSSSSCLIAQRQAARASARDGRRALGL